MIHSIQVRRTSPFDYSRVSSDARETELSDQSQRIHSHLNRFNWNVLPIKDNDRDCLKRPIVRKLSDSHCVLVVTHVSLAMREQNVPLLLLQNDMDHFYDDRGLELQLKHNNKKVFRIFQAMKVIRLEIS